MKPVSEKTSNTHSNQEMQQTNNVQIWVYIRPLVFAEGGNKGGREHSNLQHYQGDPAEYKDGCFLLSEVERTSQSQHERGGFEMVTLRPQRVSCRQRAFYLSTSKRN